MQKLMVDLVVIGSGPAGQKGAIQAAKAGKNVVMIDRSEALGGSCLHSGTIPSKTFRESILNLTGFLERSYYGQSNKTKGAISISDLNYRLHKVIEDEQNLVVRQMAKNDITVLCGSAQFQDAQCVEVRDSSGTVTHEVKSQRTLIATGSRPRISIEVPIDSDTILDSDTLLAIGHVPKTMMVLGGGIIGSEYATMFAALGTHVTLIDQAERPLPFLDKEISEHFMEYVQKMGMAFRLGNPIVSIEKSAKGRADVVLANGEHLQADCLFVAMGRTANVEGLGLANIGITLKDRKYIPINSLFQTPVDNIYAAGDVIGKPGLAATSMEQGRLAVRNAFSMQSRRFPNFFPYGVYTIPEISSIGPTEENLNEKGIHYKVGRAHYYEIGRGPISGDDKGMIKIIFHAETLEVLAVHIIGTSATELIHIGQLAIDFNARITYFVEQIFNYPTFAEGYRIAALNGLNKLEGNHISRDWVS